MRLHSRLVPLIACLLASGAALAHPGGHAESSFAVGLAHPFSGLDHLLAMLAVGLWATQLGGRNLLVIPASFVTSMALGALIGISGFQLPYMETGVSLSVLVLGLLIAFAVQGSRPMGVALVGMFALFHGYAHGIELPASSAGAFPGFLLATAMLHGFGVTAGWLLQKRGAIVRTGGAAIGLAGAWLLLAA